MNTNNLTRRQQVKDAVVRQGFLPIYVCDDLDSRVLVEGAVEAGCRVLEYTCRRHDAREMIPWIKKNHPDILVVGASLIDGPRCSAHLSRRQPNFVTVQEMVDLGVDGLVSLLGFREETYQRYPDHMFISGVSTANEALAQLEYGADLVKMQVGTPEGENLVRNCRLATHFMIPIMVTAGVTVARVDPLVAMGVVVTSAGFDGFMSEEIAAGKPVDVPAIVRRIQPFLTQMQASRERHLPEFAAAVADGRPNPMSAGPWVC